MASRAICTAALAAFLCIATFAVVSYKDQTVSGFIHASADTKKVDVLHNIIALKSYCLAAYDHARITINNHPKVQSITEFVVMYGQEGGGDDLGGKQAHVENIVLEYANVLGALIQKYGTGVNKYILQNLDKSIRHNPKGAISIQRDMQALGNGGANGRKYGHLVFLNWKALGLTDMPSIIVELAVNHPQYLMAKTNTDKAASNADAIAATLFLQSKTYGHYSSFLQREVAKVQRKMRTEFNYVAKAGYEASQEAFEQSYKEDVTAFFEHVATQAPASRKAAKKAAENLPWTPPTMEEMKKRADEAAKKFIEDYKKKAGTDDAANLVREITEQAGGVKVIIETAGGDNAGSSMQPTVDVVGKLHTISTKLNAVPGAGSTIAQHIPSQKALGDITQIVIHPESAVNHKSWACKSISIQVGGHDGKTFKLVNPDAAKDAVPMFEMKSGGSAVTLVIDKAAAAVGQYDKAHCVKFKGTAGCSGKGAPDDSNDRTCSDTIDSSLSGFCQCSDGPRARIDCGAATTTFTCDQICSV